MVLLGETRHLLALDLLTRQRRNCIHGLGQMEHYYWLSHVSYSHPRAVVRSRKHNDDQVAMNKRRKHR